MDEKNDMIGKIKSVFGQYKYVVPVIMVGLVLLLWPSSNADEEILESSSLSDRQIIDEQYELEEKLALILSAAEGVGKTQVFLSRECAASATYAENVSAEIRSTQNGTGETDNDRSSESEIMTLRGADGSETALVKVWKYPEYRGALIICQGGDDPKIRLQVTQAVSRLLAISSDAVIVMKMDQ